MFLPIAWILLKLSTIKDQSTNFKVKKYSACPDCICVNHTVTVLTHPVSCRSCVVKHLELSAELWTQHCKLNHSSVCQLHTHGAQDIIYVGGNNPISECLATSNDANPTCGWFKDANGDDIT